MSRITSYNVCYTKLLRYSAFRCAQFLKTNFPEIKVAMGGGFPNTELRDLKDVRVFEFFDFITLDDGELPVELLCKS